MPQEKAGMARAAKSLGRLFFGAILAALAMYVAGLVYWRDALPNMAVKRIYDENDFIRVLKTYFPASGTYMVPSPDDDVEAIKELRETGPLATLHLLNDRDIHSRSEVCWYQWTQALVTAFLIGWVVRQLPSGRSFYRSRVLAVAFLGLAAAIYNDLADPIWSYQPWRWSLAKAGYDLFSWTVAGLILCHDWFHSARGEPKKPTTN